MLGKVYSLLGFLGVALLLGGGALAGYLYFTGALSADRIAQISAILQGKEVGAASQPAATQSAASKPEALSGERPVDEIKRQRREDRIQRALLEQSKADVVAQRELLESAMHDLIVRGDRFDTDKKRWDDARKIADKKERDEGFDQYMEFFRKLPAAQQKEELVATWKKDKAGGLRIMNMLKPTEGKKVLELMKTPDEAEIRHDLLEQIRNQAVESFAPKSGTTSGDARN